MKKYKFLDKTLYFPKEKTLVIGDLHFGYEEELSSSGIAIPRRMIKVILEDLKRILLLKKDIEQIILLGDIRHSFGSILKQEIQDMRKFFDFIKSNLPGISIIINKGNHDTLLEIILKREDFDNVKLVDYFVLNKILFFHGDYKSFEGIEKIFNEIDLIVVGHFHPAIDITDGEKTERYKCFLKGELVGKEMIILPSFFPLIDGANILGDCELNYYNIKKKQVFVVSPDGNVLDFGKIN